MAEPGQDDQDGLKKKLVRRIALAGVAAVVLLGGLAVFEHYLGEEAPPLATPVPPPAATVAAPPPAEEKKEEPKAEEKKEEVRAEPEKTEMPLAPAPEPRPATRVVIKPPAAAPAAPAKKAATTKVERVEPAAPAPAAKADPATVLARSYRLQMGVFTSASNAEELHAKLEKAGIPSYVESRVHVGPFKTQKEADEARRKLKELGLGPGLLIPPQKR
jgi:DedD protein